MMLEQLVQWGGMHRITHGVMHSHRSQLGAMHDGSGLEHYLLFALRPRPTQGGLGNKTCFNAPRAMSAGLANLIPCP